ncbi:MAG: acyltransferase [Muribaculum sp.]|nr:acyltransferase [Muribaculum sp.]
MSSAKNVDISDTFYVMRGFAIISVAYAHSLSLNDELLQRLGEILGLFGVPIFLFCSGYWFRQDKSSILYPKLLKNIITPWLIWGSFGFIISFSLGATLSSLKNFVLFLLGHGTWLYYIPVYLIIRIIFNYLRLSDKILFIVLAISVVMSIMSYQLPHILLKINNVCTPWQNPLNWMGYFVLGILCHRHNSNSGINIFSRLENITKRIALILGCVILVVALLFTSQKINYWNPIAITLEYISIFLILIISSSIPRNKFLQVFGKNSLLLYLIHIQIGIAISNRLFGIFSFPGVVILLLKPVVVLMITMSIIYALHFVLRILNLESAQPYLGIALK